MAKTVGIGIDLDIKRMRKSLDAIGLRALPKAMSESLNAAAFDAQRGLTAEVKDPSTFDRPTKFTMSAFIMKTAKPADGDRMFSLVKAKDIQAGYLRRQIEGGDRTKDDPGARGPKDVMSWATRTDKWGGIPKNFAKAMTAEKRRERAQRAHFRSMKREFAGAVDYSDELESREFSEQDIAFGAHQRRAPTYESMYSPGIFFGQVGGVRGYFRRPKRSQVPFGKRKRGVVHARDLGGPTPLLTFSKKASYKPRFNYNEAITRSYNANTNRKAFSRALQREIAFRIERDTAKLNLRRMGPWQQHMVTPYGKAFYPGAVTFGRPNFAGGKSWRPSNTDLVFV